MKERGAKDSFKGILTALSKILSEIITVISQGVLSFSWSKVQPSPFQAAGWRKG